MTKIRFVGSKTLHHFVVTEARGAFACALEEAGDATDDAAMTGAVADGDGDGEVDGGTGAADGKSIAGGAALEAAAAPAPTSPGGVSLV